MTTANVIVADVGIDCNQRPNPISTDFAADDDGNGIAQVTPTLSDTLVDLLMDMPKALLWKCKKGDTEQTNPHPVKLKLQTQKQSIKELLSSNYQNMKRIINTKKLKDYPLPLRLLLFSLCAMISGLPGEYQVDHWNFVASAWGSDVSDDELRDVCFKSLREYLFPNEEAEDEEAEEPPSSTKDEEEEEQVLKTFLAECEESMTWQQQSSNGSFNKYLKTEFTQSESVFRHIFTDTEEPPKPNFWDIETWVFTFGMLSLTACGKASPHNLIERVTGISNSQLRRIFDANGLISLMQQIDNNIDAFASVAPTTPQEMGISHVPTEIVTPETFPTTDLAADPLLSEHSLVPSTTNSNSSSGTATLIVDDTKIELAEKVVIDFVHQALDEDPELRSPEMQQLLQDVTYRMMQEKKGKNSCICEIEGRAKTGGQKNKMIYAHLPESRKKFSNLRKTAQNDKANILVEVVEQLAGEDEYEQKNLVSKFLDKFGSFVVFLEEEFKLTMQEIAVFRSRVGMTLNQLAKWDQCERALKGNTRFPKQFKKLFSKFEKEDHVPDSIYEVELELNGNKGRAKVPLLESKSPARKLERMMKTTKLSNAFVDSEEFSTLENAIFVAFGCDKDSDHTSMMMRTINREHGNSSNYVATVSMYEDAKECYKNLKASILRKDAGNVVGCEYVILELFRGHNCDPGVSDDLALLPEMTVEVALGDDEYCSREEFEKQLTCPGEYQLQEVGLQLGETEDVNNDDGKVIGTRFKTSDVDNWRTGKRLLKVVLVTEVSHDSLDDLFYGYRLYEGHKNDDGNEVFQTTPCFVGLLEKPVSRKLEDGIINCEMQQVIGIHSADMKQAWNIKGMQDSAQAVCNCTVCTQPKETYEDHWPKWLRTMLKELYPNDTELHEKLDKMEDYPLREGLNAFGKMHDEYMDKNGGEVLNYALSAAKKVDAKRDTLCVVNEPLLRIHPSKETMGALHLSQGMINHFKDQLDKLLKEIDERKIGGTKSWMQKVDDVYDSCKEFYDDRDGEHKKLVTRNRKKQKEIASFKRIVERAHSRLRPRGMTDKAVKEAEDRLQELKDSEDITQHRKAARLKNGAKELMDAVDPYKKSMKAKGEAQSIFRRAVQTLGSKFNAQHGGMELSNAAGLNFLKNFHKISAMVKDAYELECPIKNKEVKAVMEKAEKFVDSLYPLCRLMKSQDKWSADMMKAYNKHACSVFWMWREMFDQLVFPKQHCVVWHVREFVAKFGAFGIFSEESFESRHVVLKKEHSHVKSMKNVSQRLTVFGCRIQANINAKFQDAYFRLSQAIRGKERGPYKKRIVSQTYVSVLRPETTDDDGVINISDEVAIKGEWAEVYYLIIEGKVPAVWNHVFVKRVNVDDGQSIYANNT